MGTITTATAIAISTRGLVHPHVRPCTIANESDINIKMGGSGGPLGGMLSRFGNISSQTRVEDVQTGSLADDLFSPPAGYKLNARK